MRRRLPLIALLAALAVAPLAMRPQAQTAGAAQGEPPALSQTSLPGYVEQEPFGASANDELATAEPIGDPEFFSWTQTVTGTIGTSTDVDYYVLRVSRPASQIAITMDGLPADFDLVLGGGGDTSQTTDPSDAFQPGLEGITQVGSSISSIGSSISSIGSSISSISANPGMASEAIDAQLWLPGDYYLVVTTSNGEFSADPYRLSVTLSDSGLAEPPPSPEVDVNLFASPTAAAITTLYIHHPARLAQLYGGASDELGTINSALGSLAFSPPAINGAPPEHGLILDLSDLRPAIAGGQTITDVFTLWETNQGNPLYANYVAGLIDNVIESAITGQPSGPGASFTLGFSTPQPLPNVRNVVLVGGDEVIPFYRLPDLTTIANEADYAAYLSTVNANGIIGAGNPLGAALRYRMLLTDAPYGSGKPYRFYGYPFFVPGLAVGRLVETPAQLAGFLSYYAFGSPSAFQIDATAFGQPSPPRRAFISGYDFLKDQADAIDATLRSTGLTPAEHNLLNNDAWGRPELEQAWFDGALAGEFPPPPDFISDTANIDLSSVNAHFDHWQLLPALNPSSTSSGNFPARRVLEPQYSDSSLYFGGTLGYSVGCHSGYSVIDSAIVFGGRTDPFDRALYQADFPQALNAHGGMWVGNTGYGYGTADGIDYSERLAVLYTEELARETFTGAGTPTYASVGAALVNAKQRYVRNAASLTAYDYKVVNVMTLYGLPYAQVMVSNPLAPPAEDPAPNRPSSPLELQAPKPPNSATGRLTRTITFTIAVDQSDYTPVPRTGSTLFQLDPADFTVEDEFDQLGSFPTQPVRTFNNNQVGVPTLPTFAYDISAQNQDGSDRLKVLDVVFVGGTYGNAGAFNPQVTQVTTETLDATPIVSRTDEPSFAAGAGIWFPDKFFGFSTVGDDEQQRDQLTSFAAQFRGDGDGMTGLLRPYSQMVFRVTYDDPSVSNPVADALDNDTQAPLIESVQVQGQGSALGLAQVNQALIVVRASDSGPLPGGGANQGLAEVGLIYVSGGVSWQPVALSETTPGSGIYTAIVPVKPGAVRFIVRATDAAGNSSYFTAKGRFTPRSNLALPLVIR